MTIACLRVAWSLLLSVAVCACDSSGEVAQPKVDLIPLENADLRDMVFDKRGAGSDPACLYVADANQNQIHCVNINTRALDASLTIGPIATPVALALSHENDRLFVGTGQRTGGSLLDIELATGTVTERKIFDQTLEVVETLAVLSSGQVVIGLKESNKSDARIDYWNPPTIAAGFPGAGKNLRVVGAHQDGTLLVTATATSGVSAENYSPNVFIWPTTAAVSLPSGNYFGYVVQEFSSMVFHPELHEFYVLSDAGGNNSAIPRYRVTATDVEEDLQFRFAADYPAIALAFTANRQRVLVAHGATPFDARDPRHDLSAPDLHVMDANTGAEVGVIPLPDHVHDHGIAVAPDGTIYLLLGRDKSTRIGVIRDLGN